MNIFNKITNPEKASLFIYLAPYLGIISVDVLLSPLASYANIFLLIICIVLIELLFKNLLNPVQNKLILNVLIFGISILIFYGEIIIEKSNNLLKLLLDKDIPFPYLYISIISILMMYFFYYSFKKNKEIIRFIKTFFLIFSFVMLIHKINQNKDFIRIDTRQPIVFNTQQKIDYKPIILIILDGYIAPDELYKHYHDSSIYAFSNTLKENGWEVRNRSLSNEVTTLVSLTSMFNFNIPLPNKFDISSTFWGQKLFKARLYDSLLVHQYEFYNYGIFDIGNSKKMSPIHYYSIPTSFLGELFDKSIFNVRLTQNNNYDLLNKQAKHNYWILDSMKSQIKLHPKKSFHYVHLMMPHAPYKLGKEYTREYSDKTKDYFEFWKFTNEKLKILLKDLQNNNDYRIILTGDHGYDEIAEDIKAKYTFTAFYGFDKNDTKEIKTIQDIGFLINRYSQ